MTSGEEKRGCCRVMPDAELVPGPKAPSLSRSRGRDLNVEDFRLRACRRLPGPVVDFFEGGSEDELTLARNRAAFDGWGLLPRAMRSVAEISPRTHVLGVDIDWPFIVGPTGMAGLIHPDGEIGLAYAAYANGALYSLSTMSSRSIEEVAAATPGPKAFQLYLFRDRALSLELLHRAKAAGYLALILTVDVQVPANRERDRRNGMIIPPKFSFSAAAKFAAHPAWCWNVLLRRPAKLANFSGKRADPKVSLLEYIGSQFEPNILWSDVAWVAKEWGGPLAIKGILAPDDVEHAVDHGATTVILSNHGGRQLDASISPMDILVEVVKRLEGRAELIVDGGVRRGTDMLKAMALGAKACMAGRVGLYGLGAGGTAGAVEVLGALHSEFHRDLALLGVPHASQLDASYIRRLSHQSA